MRRHATGLAAAALLATTAMTVPALAEFSNNTIKIGVLTDMSGTYSDITGMGSVEAVKMAIDEFGGSINGAKIELVYADHQNKPDIGSAIARRWFDSEGVDMIIDVVTSSVGLAVQEIGREKNKIVINTGAATNALTNKNCAPTGFHWVYDTYALSVGTGDAIVKQGGDTWFFLTADYAFGHAMESDVTKILTEAGGKVVGAVRHPFPNADFSSFLLQAQGSGAKIIALANAGQDTINAIKQAKEFGITDSGDQQMAALLLFITDVHSLGLEAAQKLFLTTGFYWDRTDDTRTWSREWSKRFGGGKMPTMVQAGDYSGTRHYLQAVKDVGTDNTDTVVAKFRATPVNDMFSQNGTIREDGLMAHDMYLAEVKTPAESKEPWDYYNIRATIPADKAWQPLSTSLCPLVKK
ncbi:ABC transporter substrate-binding protein [Segnochrobactraceae bacterium EtOH-i3]